MKFSVYEAKARLSEVIRIVKSRRRVIITERGVPVAEIIPYADGAPEGLADRVRILSKFGAVVPRREPFSVEPVMVRAGSVERFLNEDRD